MASAIEIETDQKMQSAQADCFAGPPFSRYVWPPFPSTSRVRYIWVNCDLGLLHTSWVVEIIRRYSHRLVTGLLAIQKQLGATAAGFCSSSDRVIEAFEKSLSWGKKDLHLARVAKTYPTRPDLDLIVGEELPWVVPLEIVLGIGTAFSDALAPRNHCSVVGHVRVPMVFAQESELDVWTPRRLVARSGSARPGPWVAFAGGVPNGVRWDADELLPFETKVLVVLPATHPFANRVRQPGLIADRISNVCQFCELCSVYCPQFVWPHLGMRKLVSDPQQTTSGLAGCSACGACSAACPAGLLPSVLLGPTPDQMSIFCGPNPTDSPWPKPGPARPFCRISERTAIDCFGLREYFEED